eukprot:m.62692 g.62692  ORF g.62692 m.62692 type:complete len:124 (+) comp19392_c0_seq3:102-473(+)
MMVSGGYQRLPLPVKLRDIRPSDKCWQEKVQDYSVASDFCLFKFEKTFCTLQSAFLLNLACSPPPYVFPQMVRTPAVLQDDNQIFKCSQLRWERLLRYPDGILVDMAFDKAHHFLLCLRVKER